jgi:hypothetical protein
MHSAGTIMYTAAHQWFLGRFTQPHLQSCLLFPELAINAHALGIELPGQGLLCSLQHGVIWVHGSINCSEWYSWILFDWSLFSHVAVGLQAASARRDSPLQQQLVCRLTLCETCCRLFTQQSISRTNPNN